MSRYRLLVGGVVVLVVAVFALASAAAARTAQDRHEPAHVEYTVASASAAESAAVAASPLPVETRHRSFPAIPDSIALVAVGSLLMGLAAAVRRTT